MPCFVALAFVKLMLVSCFIHHFERREVSTFSGFSSDRTSSFSLSAHDWLSSSKSSSFMPVVVSTSFIETAVIYVFVS